MEKRPGRATHEQKPKPLKERTAEDYMEGADNAMELAKVLAGQGGISDQDFLKRMARSDELVDHDGTTCGLCHNMILGAEVALEMIEAGELVQRDGTSHRHRAMPTNGVNSILAWADQGAGRMGFWRNPPCS
jgi:hypothetical protein